MIKIDTAYFFIRKVGCLHIIMFLTFMKETSFLNISFNVMAQGKLKVKSKKPDSVKKNSKSKGNAVTHRTSGTV